MFTIIHVANNRHVGHWYVGNTAWASNIVIELYISGNTAGKEGLLVIEEL
jgi:hypothetical protein